MSTRSFDEEIADIEKLHDWRQRAIALQKKAIDVLSKRPYRKDLPDWQDPGDLVEKAVMLHALRRESEQHGTRRQLINELTSIKPDDWNKAVQLDDLASDQVPIFRAASAMQALTEIPQYALSRGSLSCFYRIVRELYEVVSPSWAAGAARAEEKSGASAFVTGECTRALLVLERALSRTADAAALLGRAAAWRSNEPENATEWSKQDRALRSESLRVSLEILRPNLIVQLPTDGKDDPSSQLIGLVRAFKLDPQVTVNDLDIALANDEPKDALVKTSREASRKIACDAVGQLLSAVRKVSESEKEAEKNPNAASEQIVLALKTAAQEVRRLLAPVERFASSIIDRELAAASPHLGREVDAAELVFAASVFGHLSGWEHPKVKAALELVRKLLSPDGRLLSVRPFDIGIKGYRLHVATLEVTRRLAEVVANVDIEPEPQFIDRLMRPFIDTRAFSSTDLEPGWATDPPGPERKSEWWVTALAADALEAVVQMLDAAINRQVLRHFSVRRPSELDPKLDLGNLIYPDFGLCTRRAGQKNENRDEETVAIKLQRLRAHASTGPIEGDPRFSLILYGPPGTGKTTLAEATAKSADVPLVEITPSDILIGGAEQIEGRTRLVFSALSMLTHVVILFDEFDSILQDRGLSNQSVGAQTRTVFEFLTPGLLPKLKKLHDAAKEKRVSYILATNYVYRLDKAATRIGRFDDKCGLYPADVISRLGKLVDDFMRWKKDATAEERQLLLNVVKDTAGAPMGELGKRFSAPDAGKDPKSGTAFSYITKSSELRPVSPEAQRQGDLAKEPNEKMKDNPLYKQYWDDWETIEKWDVAAKGDASKELGWDKLVEIWTNP
jgi:hypothetical protein